MRCYSHQHIRQSTITKQAYNGDSYRPINQIARRNEDEYALVGIQKVFKLVAHPVLAICPTVQLQTL